MRLARLRELVVHPRGIEPLSKPSEGLILSVELRVQTAAIID